MLERAPHKVAFERVFFGYDGNPVLKAIDLKVEAGEVMALVGMSGGGKTSLVNLIPRFYDVTAGAVTVDGIDVRDWKDVIWAISTRADPVRDTVLVENTPIDYLDFASPVSGLGGKVGFDATNKWVGETAREWGRPIVMDPAVKARVDALWDELGLD